MVRFLDTALSYIFAYATIITSLFAVNALSDVFGTPYAPHYACATWAVFWMYSYFKELEKIFAFDNFIPPAELIQRGLGTLPYFIALFFLPSDHPQLAAVPWPLSGSLAGFLAPDTLGHVLLIEWISVIGLILIPAIHALFLTGTGSIIAILIAFGKIDPDQFKEPIRRDEPDCHDLRQSIDDLEKALSLANNEQKADKAEIFRLRCDRNELTRIEQATRQELIHCEAQRSALARKNTQLQEELFTERAALKDLRTALLDLETVVIDMRSRLHAQSAKEPKTSQNPAVSNALSALKDLIDPTPNR